MKVDPHPVSFSRVVSIYDIRSTSASYVMKSQGSFISWEIFVRIIIDRLHANTSKSNISLAADYNSELKCNHECDNGNDEDYAN